MYPGVGWVVWRDQAALPEELIFKVNYLGGQMPTFALNFSRPGSNVIAQYYNFLRLGFNGYREVQQACQDVAVYLSSEIAKIGPFELLTEGKELPVFAFKLRDDVTSYSVFDISERLRARGWLVPAYTFPANLQETAVIRIVVKNGFSQDMASALLTDLRKQVTMLEAASAPAGAAGRRQVPPSHSVIKRRSRRVRRLLGPRGRARRPAPGRTAGAAQRQSRHRSAGPR